MFITGEATVAGLIGTGHQFIQGDVSKYADHENIIKHIGRTLKRIDIVVCCAGIYSPEYQLDDKMHTQYYIDNMIDINLKGSIFAVQTALPYLKQSSHPRIILISSITGHATGLPGFAVYGATKSGQVDDPGQLLTASLSKKYS